MMRTRSSPLAFPILAFLALLAAPGALAQSSTSAVQSSSAATEIPMQRCDKLPVVILQVDAQDKRFLVDTAATSFLNAKSFTSHRTKEVHIQSWNQTTSLSASDISIAQLSFGTHTIRDVTLPAIDLTAVSKACGGRLDGILGIDLLERLGVTIDLERSVARLGSPSADSGEGSVIDQTSQVIGACAAAFNSADAEKLAACFDSEFALSSPIGELHGREQALNYFRQYFRTSPKAHLSITLSDSHGVGELVWSLYDYLIETPSLHTAGRGIMLCRKSDNRWHILSMHESPALADSVTKP
jgi:ketosteroid isomerase-like protein